MMITIGFIYVTLATSHWKIHGRRDQKKL